MQALNQVVLWDKIVLRGDNPKLLLKDMKAKYFSLMTEMVSSKQLFVIFYMHCCVKGREKDVMCF